MSKASHLSLLQILKIGPKRLVLLTVIMLALLIAATGAIIAHSLTSSLPQLNDQKFKHIPILDQQRQLIIGLDPNFPPYRYQDQQAIKGYEADLARALATEIGLPLQLKSIKSQQLFPPHGQANSSPLATQTIHAYLSGINATAGRQQLYNLSQPYVTISLVLVALKEKPDLDSSHQLADYRLATTPNGAGQEYLLKHSHQNLVFNQDVNQLINRLHAYQTDYLLLDLANAKQAISQDQRLKIASPSLVEDAYVIVTNLNQPDMAQLFDRALTSLKQKGVLHSLENKWLNYAAPQP